MLPLVLVCLGIATLLSVLYVSARQHPVLGDALSFLCVLVARPFVKLQKVFEKAGSYCTNVFEKSLRYRSGITDDAWHGVHVIARILLLLESIIIILGDLYGTLQTLPILFGGAGAVTLPGSFAVPSSLLFVCMSVMYGHGLLEAVRLISAHLFANMTEKVRKWLGVLCGIGFVLSLVFAVLFWVFKGWFIADPESAGVLVIPVLALVGLLVTGASILALWGLVIGLTGLASIVFWLLSTVFHLAASIVSLVPSLLDVLALHFTQGTMSVYGDFLGHDPYKAPSSPFPLTRQLSLGQKNTAIAVLPQHVSSASIVDADIETQEMEVLQMNLEKSASLSFYGGFGKQMYPLLAKAVDELNAENCIKSSSCIVLPVITMHTEIGRVVDRTPSIEKRHGAALHSTTQGETYKVLIDADAHCLIETHLDLKSVPGVLTFFIGSHELIECIDALESIHNRYNLSKTVVVTEVSSHDLENKVVQVGLADLQALVSEDIVESLVVTDPASPIAGEYGLDKQHEFIAKLMVSLLIAASHNDSNVAGCDIVSALHTCAEFVVIHAASKQVAVGRKPKRVAWVPYVKDRIGTGRLSDILAQGKGCIDEVLTNEETAMFPLPPGAGGEFRVVIVDVPIQLNDPRFSVCCAEFSHYCQTNYPNTLCITVRGNGVAPIHHIGSPFLLSAYALVPVTNPASLFHTPSVPSSVKVTQLYKVPAPDPLTSNGNVPAISNQVVKPAKAVTRQKKAPTRRVVRKNKQA